MNAKSIQGFLIEGVIKVKKIGRLQYSIDEYLVNLSIDEILQDARTVLESDDPIYRRALAGTIMASLDSIRISQSLSKN